MNRRYLLDTHIVIWWLEEKIDLISAYAYDLISDTENIIYVSSVSAWEISIKKSLKKLTAPDNLRQMISEKGFWELNINFEHASEVKNLENIHKDPFDRMLVSQAKVENLTLITKDQIFKKYKIPVVI